MSDDTFRQFAEFTVFDPHESFFSGKPAAFRNSGGETVVKYSPEAFALLMVAHEAAQELMGDDEAIGRDGVVDLVTTARKFIEVLRTELPLATVRDQGESGDDAEPLKSSELDPIEILSLHLEAIDEAASVTPFIENRLHAFRGLWALAALELVDFALGAAKGEGARVGAAIQATMAVANAKALRAMATGAQPPFQFDFAEHGRQGGIKRWSDDPTQKVKPFVHEEWLLWRANRRYFVPDGETLEEFAARMGDRFPGVKASTIRKVWHPMWRDAQEGAANDANVKPD